jgi:hypothetical protein
MGSLAGVPESYTSTALPSKLILLKNQLALNHRQAFADLLMHRSATRKA